MASWQTRDLQNNTRQESVGVQYARGSGSTENNGLLPREKDTLISCVEMGNVSML